MVRICRVITAFFVWLSLLQLAYFFAELIKPVYRSCSGGGLQTMGIFILIFSLWPIRLWRQLKSFQMEDCVDSAWIWFQAFVYLFVSFPLTFGIITAFDLPKEIAIGLGIVNVTAVFVGLGSCILELRRDARG